MRYGRGALEVAAFTALVACTMAKPAPLVRMWHGVPLAPSVTCYTDTDCSTYNTNPYVRTRSKFGIGCMGNVPPGTTMNAVLPPESYRAADVGEPGFPSLAPNELAVLRRIERYAHSQTLRLAWVGPGEPHRNEFVVFDARHGPCVVAGGYPVLNGGCNEKYEPGETPYRTIADSGCFPSNRPWMRR